MTLREMRTRIEILKYTRELNEAGEEVKKWSLFCKPWAKIERIGNGREITKANKQQLTMVYEIVIRYRKDIDTNMCVKYRDKLYNINHIVNYKELNKELHLLCTLIEEGVYNE